MDFGVWGNSGGNNMDQGNSQQQQSEQPSNTQNKGNSNGGGNNGNGSNDNGGVVLMHHMEHSGVVCDICDTTVCGFRYKCMQCPDFDLCHFCERKGHHAGHIMMRISFPEQASDAIRRYLQNGGDSPSPHRPTPFCGTSPKDWGKHGTFGGHHRRGDRHSARHHGRGGRDSSPETQTEESPGVGHGCPYQMSKKGFHKWTKYMKKAARHHHRSAEAYAQSASQANAGNESQEPGSTQPAASAAPNSFDYTFAASQIQEFLNAWGVPIDVVELYDEFGNRGQMPQSAPANESNANKNSSGDQTKSAENKTPGASSERQTPATSTESQAPSVSQGLLSDQLQQLNIGNHGDNVVNDAKSPSTPAPATVPAASAPSMDMDGEIGWTLIDRDFPASETPGGSINVENSVTEDSRKTGKVTFDLPIADATPSGKVTVNEANQVGEVSRNSSLSQSSNFNSIQEPVGTTGPTPAAAVPVNTLPMYPVLNAMQNPQFQQMMQGVTNAVGSAIRSIPMVPMGMGGFPRPQQPAQMNSTPTVPKPEESGNSIPELDANCVTTLNQLLSMGFSNHDGWLARLVVAKKGDLEAVLNALFPGGAP